MAIKQTPKSEAPATQVADTETKDQEAAKTEVIIGGDDNDEGTGLGSESTGAGTEEDTTAQAQAQATPVPTEPKADAAPTKDPAKAQAKGEVLALAKLSTYIVGGLVFKSGLKYTLDSNTAKKLLKEKAPNGELVFVVVEDLAEGEEVVVLKAAEPTKADTAVVSRQATDKDITITHNAPKVRKLSFGTDAGEAEVEAETGTITV